MYVHKTNKLNGVCTFQGKDTSHIDENIILHSNNNGLSKCIWKVILVSKAYFIKCIVNSILSVFYTSVILISYKNTLNKRFMKNVANLIWPTNRNSFCVCFMNRSKHGNAPRIAIIYQKFTNGCCLIIINRIKIIVSA